MFPPHSTERGGGFEFDEGPHWRTVLSRRTDREAALRRRRGSPLLAPVSPSAQRSDRLSRCLQVRLYDLCYSCTLYTTTPISYDWLRFRNLVVTKLDALLRLKYHLLYEATIKHPARFEDNGVISFTFFVDKTASNAICNRWRGFYLANQTIAQC